MTKSKNKVPLRALAMGIDTHLKRLEADKSFNKPLASTGLQPLYVAGASYTAGRYITVTYICFQGHSHLDRGQAERYLAYLDGGGTAKHHTALRSKS